MPDARRRKRLIEVAFPLEEVSEHSRREKNVRHGHISTLHIWWARRPLAACRAFIYASLIDDPEDDREREELLKEIADLASWDAVRKPDEVVRSKEKGGSGLTGHKLLERARRRILDCNGGKPPRLLDPFAGGGAIPLEALRLGCEVEASDLNPVAVLILKGTIEYPQKYGRPLAEQKARASLPAHPERGAARSDAEQSKDIAGVDGEVPQYIIDAAKSDQSSFFDGDLVEAYRKNPVATDVRYWGNWMLERAREELAEFYPPDPDGSVPVAYLWSRTVPCPNCGAEMPLIRQYWLARKDKKKVALQPVIDRENKRVGFDVVEGTGVTGDPAEATTTRGDTVCLFCRQVAKAEYIRKSGAAGRMSAVPTAVALESSGRGGKRYRRAAQHDIESVMRAAERLRTRQGEWRGHLSLVPDEPIDDKTLGLRIDEYGLGYWGSVFGDRPALAIIAFQNLIGHVHRLMVSGGTDPNYANAVTLYLAFALDRVIDYSSQLTRWLPTLEAVAGTYSSPTLQMVWDFVEPVPVRDFSGTFSSSLTWVIACLDGPAAGRVAASVSRRDARKLDGVSVDTIITDPPYYDAIDYAGLSDFFYVWLKRTPVPWAEAWMNMPLTPKKEQAIMRSESSDPDARRHYVESMAMAFRAARGAIEEDGVTGVVFAHSAPDAWSTLIEGLISADLTPDASWPIDSERSSKMSSESRALLATSVWMACTPRQQAASTAFLDDVLGDMRPVIRERLLYFWSKGIRGADFFISAIGPALSVFGRHTKVMYPDGKDVSVRDFLDLVRREATHVALEQVLGGAVLGQLDSLSQQYVTWVWSYSRAPLDAGEAIALCLATGADYGEVVRPGSIAAEVKEKSKKMVKLRTVRERGAKEEELGVGNGARPVPLIDQLQRAAYLWSLTRTDQLAAYRASLGETRWTAMRTLGQAVAECLPEGDEDRRLIHGLLGSNVMATTPREDPSRASGRAGLWREQPGRVKLPGFEGNLEGAGEGE